jgi:energy-coupling factor transport system ATP-binding protein
VTSALERRSGNAGRGAIRFEEVSFRFPDSERDALRDVTVTIEEGTFALAVGPTGAGKSTFLRAVNGLVPHFTGGRFRGRVTVDGRSTTTFPPRALADSVAFVPQDPAASFVLDRVEEEIAYGMENLGVDPAHMRRRVEEMLDLLDLEPLRDRSVRSLSGGERQRVAIAAALAAGPRILALDEPTSQLDPQAAEHVVAALQRLVHDQGMTVLLAEHRLERVAGFVDLALGFEAGRVAAGDPADVIRRLAMGPPVARLGRLAGWDPVPLTVRDARRIAPESLGHGPRNGGAPPLDPMRTPADRPLLFLDAVEARHDGIVALRGVRLQVRPGEVVAVMGRNGAGKTTLLRAIAGVHEPADGRVAVHDHPPRPGVDAALCPQEPESILFADTVADEVRATLRARGLGAAPEPVLEALGIDDLAMRHPRDLSAGQRLLVATAAIVAGMAPVLLLDEPTRGLDPDAKRLLVRFLRRHAAGGGAALVATHDVELAAEVATRVVMLAGGEVIADGDPGHVLGDSIVFAPQMTRAFGAGWLTPDQVADALERRAGSATREGRAQVPEALA